MARTIVRRGPPEATIQDVSEDVDRLDSKINQALTDLEEIKETLERIVSSIDELQKSVDEKE